MNTIIWLGLFCTLLPLPIRNKSADFSFKTLQPSPISTESGISSHFGNSYKPGSISLPRQQLTVGNVKSELSGKDVPVGGTSVEENASAGRGTVGVASAGIIVGVATAGEMVGVAETGDGEPQAERVKDKTTRVSHTGAVCPPIIILASLFCLFSLPIIVADYYTAAFPDDAESDERDFSRT
jgi:hypothetical protein